VRFEQLRAIPLIIQEIQAENSKKNSEDLASCHFFGEEVIETSLMPKQVG
jgi:hypothetical protein